MSLSSVFCCWYNLDVSGKKQSKDKVKRPRTNKVSYREMESTDNESDDDDIKKTPKKRKKMSSESE